MCSPESPHPNETRGDQAKHLDCQAGRSSNLVSHCQTNIFAESGTAKPLFLPSQELQNQDLVPSQELQGQAANPQVNRKSTFPRSEPPSLLATQLSNPPDRQVPSRQCPSAKCKLPRGRRQRRSLQIIKLNEKSTAGAPGTRMVENEYKLDVNSILGASGA